MFFSPGFYDRDAGERPQPGRLRPCLPPAAPEAGGRGWARPRLRLTRGPGLSRGPATATATAAAATAGPAWLERESRGRERLEVPEFSSSLIYEDSIHRHWFSLCNVFFCGVIMTPTPTHPPPLIPPQVDYQDLDKKSQSISHTATLGENVRICRNSIMHYKEIWIYVFPEKELRGLSPNFHIQMSVSDLYIPT